MLALLEVELMLLALAAQKAHLEYQAAIIKRNIKKLYQDKHLSLSELCMGMIQKTYLLCYNFYVIGILETVLI